MSKLVPEGRHARKGDGGVAVLHEATPGGMRKMRCPGTHQLAVPMRTRDGQAVMRTPNGTTYVTKKLGK